jgi:hypothetical protein
MPRNPTFKAFLLAVATVAAVLVVAAGCSSEPTASTSTRTATPGPSERFQTPASLLSYRWTLEVEAAAELIATAEEASNLGLGGATLNIHIDGARLNPDREWTHALSTFGYITIERETIVIGERLWSRQKTGAWRERATLNSPEDLIGQDVALSPAVILGTEDAEYLEQITRDLNAQPFDVQVVNGRETRHWALSKNFIAGAFDALADNFPVDLAPEDVNVEVWADVATSVATRIVLTARSEARTEAFRMTMDIYDINDPDILVEEPIGAIGR